MMTKLLYTLFALFIGFNTLAQVVITDTTTTASRCFNDGTIRVAASGGTGPYTFTIISGPTYPNITYPIVLPPLATSFQTLPRGTYTIKVVDAAGGISFATATVGGNYTFPVLTATITPNNCIQVAVTGGRAPYQYAISSQGTNTGFGPYQNSNIFCVCTGHYWVRVLDSCSNIFTTAQIDLVIPSPAIQLASNTSGVLDSIYTTIVTGSAPPYTFHLSSGSQSYTNTTGIFAVPKSCKPDTVTMTDRCGTRAVAAVSGHDLNVGGLSDCATGSAIVSISSSSLGPFVITGPTGTQTSSSHNISVSGLPLNQTYNFTVTDSCGNTASLSLPCNQDDTLFFQDVCPFDSMLHLRHNQINYCYPVILTCLSCSPVQRDTVYSTPAPVFQNIDTGVPYTIRIQDACGFDYTTHYTTYWGPLSIRDSAFTCSDFVAMSDPPVFVPPVQYSVYNGSTLIQTQTANRPIFYHMPAGGLTVVGHHALCRDGRAYITLPFFGGKCAAPMMDSSCQFAYAIFQPYMASPETFTLVNTASGQVYSERLPRPTGSPILFSNVPVGNYNLVSDSGCSIPYNLPAYHYDVNATYRLECTGQSQINASVTPGISTCNTSQGQYFTLVKDGVYYGGNNTGTFVVADTGLFTINLYLSNTSIFNLPARYDTLCPLDTAMLFVHVRPIPNVVSVQQEVCGGTATANLPYTILGGTAPYTISIIGYPTRTVSSTQDTFPGLRAGIYTMIVADDCGTSRSFSVAIVDTCATTCAIVSRFALSDSVVCRGATRVTMTNQSIAASHYKWVINGVTYGYTTDTAFIAATPGTYHITLYSYLAQCVDSSKHTLLVEDTLRSAGTIDTFICLPSSLTLNSHNAHSVWSTGSTDSVIQVSTQGTYWVRVANSCGAATDSFKIGTHQAPTFDLMAPDSALCNEEQDSVVLLATLNDTTGLPRNFIWSTGFTDSSVYASQVIVYQADTYSVLISDTFCPVRRGIVVLGESCDSLCLIHIAIPNAFSPNGDGKNDTFHLIHICDFDPFEMHIYNRWGELVFRSTDINQGWDGKYKGAPQPSEVYWWHVTMGIHQTKPIEKAGRVTLFR